MHVSVLLKEVITLLDPQAGDFFIDGTLGSGGHAVEIIERLESNGIFLGVDWDEEAVRSAELRIKNYELRKTIVIQDNYANLPEILRKKKLPRANGLLLDLGLSSEQLEKSGRGFSFLRDEPLDMRYSMKCQMTNDKCQSITAREVINKYSERALANIFWEYGEERFSRRIARKAVEIRKKKPITTTFDLVEIIKKSVPKSYVRSRIHIATRVFQALRIYVNKELENLEVVLKSLNSILKPSGRAAIISFHSLEDRLVKNEFKKLAKEGKAMLLTKKPVTPTLEEVRKNPRSRSAKLRAIQMRYQYTNAY